MARMLKDKDFERLVLHISRDLHNQLFEVAEKNKLSISSVIRAALHNYVDANKQGKSKNENRET